MATIPARRILATGALTARPCLRVRIPSSSPVIRSSGRAASFSSSASVAKAAEAAAAVAGTRTIRKQAVTTPSSRGSVRWSTTSAPPESKIWTFEEIQALSERAPPRPVLIDVREPDELAATGRIPGAVNVPVTTAPDSFHVPAAEFEARFGFARPPADAELVFYCRAGVRSRAAAAVARHAGWSRVGEYPGSWLDWSARGGRVER
ncbi:putative rhodanese domain-containing protein [Rosellinia necatrix]|uniref:Putative rhodanese domain-containing protein n=1 Tax=Rosellinia necatrix TaxID=77044 RepID=A0A1S8ABQ5_ROSNE|nr:putative rhodanese domain-containing protein [Rosellinia necatrix]